MYFSNTLSLLALSAAAFAQNTTTTTTTFATSHTSSTTATPTPDFEAICESQASTYASSCPQCLPLCESSSVPDQCYYSVFSAINYIQSMCEAQNGYNCRDTAINDVCTGGGD